MENHLSKKRSVQILLQQCVAQGLKEIVISPGSRNAPLILSFSNIPEIKCYTIVDERSAAFFAMGMAQQLKRPVALLCTSGSAALNYAPAIVESYYQEIPLVVLTADRPAEWLGQADGQTIPQNGLYNNYVRYQATLPVECSHQDDAWYAARCVSEAFYKAQFPVKGPVHINVPLREPLYEMEDVPVHNKKTISSLIPQYSLSFEQVTSLKDIWDQSKSVMILGGVFNRDENFNETLNDCAKKNNVVVLTETTTNIQGEEIIKCIDRQLALIKEEEKAAFSPELLITFGGQIVSKHVKKFLRDNPPKNHWHISLNESFIDTFQHLTLSVKMNPFSFFKEITEFKEVDSDFKEKWQHLKGISRLKHESFVNDVTWCDLRAFDFITKNIPTDYDLQLANSTPVRYAQLFQDQIFIPTFGNRGASGIDGTLSTALGACVGSERKTLAITGDLSFFYDSNALWNKYLNPNFKIILINNGGGGIFKFIPGPAETKQVDEFFEARHSFSAQSLVENYNASYFSCSKEQELQQSLKNFFAYDKKTAVLEIFTREQDNGQILRSYFKFLSGI